MQASHRLTGPEGHAARSDENTSLFEGHFGPYRPAVEQGLRELPLQRVVPRLWDRDPTLWKPDPKEITNRLGWLDIADRMRPEVPCLTAFADQVIQDGIRDILLLGMGGSSLAPEVFASALGGDKPTAPHLTVLDTTDPDAVLVQAARLDPSTTMLTVSSKSGGTEETLSLLRFFWAWVVRALGPQKAGPHFVAITDPGTSLERAAAELGFRTTFRNDPNIGGRYAALSYVGLVPAALIGVDLERVLATASAMAERCRSPAGANPGAWLGTVLAELAHAGRDKLTFVLSPEVESFCDWVEQLVAESTGKEGEGILPVVREPVGAPDAYGEDRLFIHVQVAGDPTHGDDVRALQAAGHPVVRITLRDPYDLGGQFFLWQFATAVASHRRRVNPFNQPDVEAAKAIARRAVAIYRATGRLPEDTPTPLSGQALRAFLSQGRPGDYVALQAYLHPNAETDAALAALRARIRDLTRLATTVGYGPRFLHSTGQLHKGDRGNGLFIQFTSNPVRDVAIPTEEGGREMTFGTLKTAQALGDRDALEQAGRRVIRLHLGSDPTTHLTALTHSLR